MIAALLVSALLAGCVAEEMLDYSVRSPHGTWEARAYYVNPGAAATAWGRVDVIQSSDGEIRELWRGPQLPSAPVWLDDDTILVGEQVLDARTGQFDWYKDSEPAGFANPESAVRSYVEAVVSSDLRSLQEASEFIVTREVLNQIRESWFAEDGPNSLQSLQVTQLPEGVDPDQAS